MDVAGVGGLSFTAEHAPKFWKDVFRADLTTAAMGVQASLPRTGGSNKGRREQEEGTLKKGKRHWMRHQNSPSKNGQTAR